MVLKLFKYIFGYVIFNGTGGFVERFINLCAIRRITLWDVSLHDNTIRAKIRTKDFRKLRSIARKTGVRINITDKCGLPFYLRNHKDRVGLLIGACMFIFFMTVMNTMVWCIHTENSEKFSRQQILEAADNAGLHYGIRVKNFDEEKAAREIYKAFKGELSWVKVNVKGSLAVIDFRENIKKLEKEEKGSPSNIIADFDGIILSDETYQGSKNKSRGDAVRKGEVLISGVVEGVDMKPLYYEAKGKYTALHQRNIEHIMKNNESFYNYEKLDNQFLLCVFGMKIPLSFLSYYGDQSDVYCYEKYLEFDGRILPFGIKKSIAVNYNKCELTQAERQQIAILNFSDEEYKQLSNTKILERNTRVLKENNALIVSGEYNCIDYIGERKEINMEIYENS